MRKRLQKAALIAAVATVSAAAAAGSPAPTRTTSLDAGTRLTAPRPAVRRGRPRKFNRPSTAVTLTLPDDVIATLQRVDRDLSRAVVRAARPLAAHAHGTPVELATFGDRTAVILVPPSASLQEHVGVDLVPLWDGRAMLAFRGDLSMAEIELRVGDALAHCALTPTDRAIFQELMTILQSARRAGDITLSQRSIIVLHPSALEPRVQQS